MVLIRLPDQLAAIEIPSVLCGDDEGQSGREALTRKGQISRGKATSYVRLSDAAILERRAPCTATIYAR